MDILNKDVLDSLQELAEEDDDEDIIGELVGLFESKSPGLIVEIRDSFARQDWKSLEGKAHKLKGSAANLGLQVLAGICSEIEDKSNAGITEGLAELVESLEDNYNTGLRELKSHWARV